MGAVPREQKMLKGKYFSEMCSDSEAYLRLIDLRGAAQGVGACHRLLLEYRGTSLARKRTPL